MKQRLRSGVIYVLIMAVLNLASPVIAQAQIIGTLATLESQQRANDLATVNATLSRAEVRQQLAHMGVDAATVDARVAKLTDSELRQLAHDINSAPAGGDALAVIGIVFLVLLILEVTGVIDIFKKFP